ncbi:MAG: serine/threonine-protein kinase [Pseudomonadota bacterium]
MADVEICPSTGRELGISFRLAGRTIGKYRIERLIAEGGMGVVLEAVHEAIGRKVALKFLHPRFLLDREMRKRFSREAKAAAGIGHENIINIIDIDQEDESGATYIVMEYLEGQNLGWWIEKKGQLPVKWTVDITLQVLSALNACHCLGIIHRDMKPENIFITRRANRTDLVKLLDFGTAKIKAAGTASILTGEGTVLGTPHYMSPELLEGGDKFDFRTDLYSCGVLLYQCLTGKLPFDARRLIGIYHAIMNDTPESPQFVRPDLPDGLVEVVMKSFARNRDERYAGAADMAAALEPFGSGMFALKEEMAKGEELARTARSRLGPISDSAETAAEPVFEPPAGADVPDRPPGVRGKIVALIAAGLVLLGLGLAAVYFLL